MTCAALCRVRSGEAETKGGTPETTPKKKNEDRVSVKFKTPMPQADDAPLTLDQMSAPRRASDGDDSSDPAPTAPTEAMSTSAPTAADALIDGDVAAAPADGVAGFFARFSQAS